MLLPLHAFFEPGFRFWGTVCSSGVPRGGIAGFGRDLGYHLGPTWALVWCCWMPLDHVLKDPSREHVWDSHLKGFKLRK